MTVHFIGAGPGAPDLITLRARDLIASCPVCLYAGSLVPEAILAHCPDGATVVNTAPMDLDQIIAACVEAHEKRSGRGASALGRFVGLVGDGRANGASEGPGNPGQRDPRRASLRRCRRRFGDRTDAARCRAIGGADPNLGARFGHAAQGDACQFRGHRRRHWPFIFRSTGWPMWSTIWPHSMGLIARLRWFFVPVGQMSRYCAAPLPQSWTWCRTKSIAPRSFWSDRRWRGKPKSARRFIPPTTTGATGRSPPTAHFRHWRKRNDAGVDGFRALVGHRQDDGHLGAVARFRGRWVDRPALQERAGLHRSGVS